MVQKIKLMIIDLIRIKYRIKEIIMKKKVAECKGRLFIGGGSPTSLSRTTHLGHNTNFNGMIIKGQGHVYIGDNFHSGQNCLILTSNHNYEGSQIPYDSENINKDVVIEDNVWLGDNVVILPGSYIEEGAIIQAGSVVVNRIPKCAIAGGHPAKQFSCRSIDHYDSLKSKKQFH